MPLFNYAFTLSHRQLGDLGVLRGVIRGFSEEARTRGIPSPSFGGFGFVVVGIVLSIVGGCQIASRSAMSASRPESVRQGV